PLEGGGGGRSPGREPGPAQRAGQPLPGRDPVGSLAKRTSGARACPAASWPPAGSSREHQRGRYQLCSTSSASEAGTSTPRTMVASISTAEARPTPIIFSSMMDSVAKMENTATMITAALVTTPEQLAMPPTT